MIALGSIIATLLFFSLSVNVVSADTIYDQCNKLDKSSCPTNLYDSNSCYDTTKQYYDEIGEEVYGSSETDNWTADSCASTLSGCFIPIPGHVSSWGAPLGICIPPLGENPTERVNCNNVRATEYRNQCPSDVYTLCYDTDQKRPPHSVIAEADCTIDPPGSDELIFFYDLESYEEKAARGVVNCSPGQPLSTQYPSFCDGERSVSCTTSDRHRCCSTEAECQSIGGSVNRCQAIPPISGNLGDCAANLNKPYLCSQVGSLGNMNYFCCSDEPACKSEVGGTLSQSLKGKPLDYCRQVPGDFEDKTTQRGACYDCITQGKPGDYIFTAVGCVQVSGRGLAEDLIRLLLGVAGGAAFLSILAAAFTLTISRGESAKVKQAKELITAAITGLLFIIFSIIILDYIGVTILQIPGLG